MLWVSFSLLPRRCGLYVCDSSLSEYLSIFVPVKFWMGLLRLFCDRYLFSDSIKCRSSGFHKLTSVSLVAAESSPTYGGLSLSKTLFTALADSSF